MQIVSTQKYYLLSPRKIRPIARMIKNMSPAMAIDILPHVAKRGAIPLSKVIKSALASARLQGLNETDLTLKEIQIGEGPRLKRGRPVSRGRWHPYQKRMSHIRVVLESKEVEKEKGDKKSGTKD